MTGLLKKHAFLLPFTRFFTRAENDAYSAIPFDSSESFGDEPGRVLAAPVGWSAEAVEVMAAAACPAFPATLCAIEENTVPSWLWRHRGIGAKRESEGDVRIIFDRVAGSAAAKGWKLNLFASEKHARAFYDETRYALMQRHIAIAPELMASWGLNWAYGIAEKPATGSPAAQETILTNATIDALTGTGKSSVVASLGKKLFPARGKISGVTLRLSDIAQDWHSSAPNPAQACIDVLALRHNDGSVNIGALRQAARLLTLLLDLQECGNLTIGLANLAPLLLALGLAYDSDAGRALAASLASLVTAECLSASAEMAALRGVSAVFTAEREAIMRSLRNHRRAIYGDSNDYEKLSVLPAPLPLKNCPDLALAAEAQRGWDDALERVRSFGLRGTLATDLTPSPLLAVLMESATQGIEPMPRLTMLSDLHIILHPAIGEALMRLDYPHAAAGDVARHIAGTRSLRKAPGVNPATLRARGFDEEALEKVENYLPEADRIELAVTPWIVGIDFCRKQLKIPARKLEQPGFSLLRHMGFTDADIAAANAYCYGHGTVRNARILNLRHRPIFACGNEISAEARLRMAAAVQSFISCDTGLVAHLPQAAERGAEFALAAWRRGVKSLTVIFDEAAMSKAQPSKKTARKPRRIVAATQSHGKAATPVKRTARGKRLVSPGSRKSTERRTRHA